MHGFSALFPGRGSEKFSTNTHTSYEERERENNTHKTARVLLSGWMCAGGESAISDCLMMRNSP
jgi:hypothetical protein